MREEEACIYFIYSRIPSSTLSRRSGERDRIVHVHKDIIRKVQVSKEIWEEDWLNYWTSVQNRRAKDAKNYSIRGDSKTVG